MNDWLREYIKFTLKHESPLAFHLWTGLTVIAGALGRNIWFDRGFYKIYPGQIMTILVAGSAKLRKSTGAKIGINLLKQADVVKIVSGKTSPEAFIDELDLGMTANNGRAVVQDSHVLVFASELASFLSRQSYTDALIPILTDLADAPDKWEFKTRGHGSKVLTNVSLTFLGASTPDWLAAAIPENAFGGGFMSRIFFVYQEETDRHNALPTLSDFDMNLEQELIQGLQRISTLRGPVTLDVNGREFFIRWYDDYMKTSDSNIDGYWGRRADHLLRIGMCIAASREVTTRQVLVLTRTILEEAIQYIEAVEHDMPQAFRFVGASAIGREQENVIRLLTKGGGNLSMQELMRMTWRRMDVAILRQAIDTLKAAGLVTETVSNGQPYFFLQLGKD